MRSESRCTLAVNPPEVTDATDDSTSLATVGWAAPGNWKDGSRCRPPLWCSMRTRSTSASGQLMVIVAAGLHLLCLRRAYHREAVTDQPIAVGELHVALTFSPAGVMGDAGVGSA